MPRRTELDRPCARREFTAQRTLIPPASTRYRAALRGTTTQIRSVPRLEASCSVLRNRLTPCRRARDLGRPNRPENPAASTTICSLRGLAAFIGIMLLMKSERALQHRPFLTPIWLSAIGAFAV